MPGWRTGSWIANGLWLIAVLACSAVALAAPADKLAPYAYEDTKDLVDAGRGCRGAGRGERRGGLRRVRHPGIALAQRPVLLLRLCPRRHVRVPSDLAAARRQESDGSPRPQRQAGDQAHHRYRPKRPEKDASGWVFYLWEEQTQLSPQWKSAYVRKAVAPDGKVYLVGSGVYNIKIEKPFIVERVNDGGRPDPAPKGKDAAFPSSRTLPRPTFSSTPTSSSSMRTGIRSSIPPSPRIAGRDLSELKDAVGFQPIKELLAKLAGSDEAWVQFLWPEPGAVRALAEARLCPQGQARRRDADRGIGLLPADADLDEGRRGRRMAKKPAGLTYGVDDRPPWPASRAARRPAHLSDVEHAGAAGRPRHRDRRQLQ